MNSVPKRTVYAVPASPTNAPLLVPITVPGVNYIEIAECPPTGTLAGPPNSNNFQPQGLAYALPDDGFLQYKGLVPGDFIPIGDHDAGSRAGGGRGLGFPARPDPGNPGQFIPARIIAAVVSATATPTQVEVREWA